MTMFKKYMQAIYTVPGSLHSSNNSHRILTEMCRYKQMFCDWPFQSVAQITSFTFFRLYYLLKRKAKNICFSYEREQRYCKNSTTTTVCK